jgi:CDP-4-dehydro-6-deoxyglucose reductase
MVETRKRARIAESRALSPSVRGLLLEPVGGPLAFTAGQWVDLYIPTAAGLHKRAYSIASAPGAPLLELAVTLVESGVASPALHALAPGAELELAGPFGFFTRDDATRGVPALFVATGTGLSPLRSMLFEWRAQPQRAPIHLLFGCRSQADILWRDQLERLAADEPLFALSVTLSRPDPGWRGRTGYVQQHVAELARLVQARAHATAPPQVFICGLNRMVGEVRALCKRELGLDRKSIHSERYD